MSYYWVNLFDITAMSKERYAALENWLTAQGLQLAIDINNEAAPLDSSVQKDLDEEAEAQGVKTQDLLRMDRQG